MGRGRLGNNSKIDISGGSRPVPIGEWEPLPCPLCDGARNVIVMACSDCWIRTRAGDGLNVFNDEQLGKLAIFERCAPLNDSHRMAFNDLKQRTNLP